MGAARLTSTTKFCVPVEVVKTAANLPLRVLDVAKSVGQQQLYTVTCQDWNFHAVSHYWGMDHVRWMQEAQKPHFFEILQALGNMGAQYLWIDTICITQTDKTEVAAEIKKMAAIYGSSLSTFVFTNGMHARSRLVSNNAVEPWFDRVWTYQEFIMPHKVWFVLDGDALTWPVQYGPQERLHGGNNLFGVDARECYEALGHATATIKDAEGAISQNKAGTRMWRKYRQVMHCRNSTNPDFLSVSLWEVFKQAAERKCSVEIDKVNGVLSVLGVTDWVADYQLSCCEEAFYEFMHRYCEHSMPLRCLLTCNTAYSHIQGCALSFKWVLPLHGRGLLDGLDFRSLAPCCTLVDKREHLHVHSENAFFFDLVLHPCRDSGNGTGYCCREYQTIITGRNCSAPAGWDCVDVEESYRMLPRQDCVHGKLVCVSVGDVQMDLSIPEICGVVNCCKGLAGCPAGGVEKVTVNAVAIAVAETEKVLAVEKCVVIAYTVLKVVQELDGVIYGSKIGVAYRPKAKVHSITESKIHAVV